MTKRVFEYGNAFGIDDDAKYTTFAFDSLDGHLLIRAASDEGDESQYVDISLTPEESTALKKFLEKQGF